MKFEKHIFICTNERNDPNRKSCGEACGMELVKAFKKTLNDKGWKKNSRTTFRLFRCLWFRSLHGCISEGIYYGGVQLSDVDEIINEHIINNRPVQRLITDFSKVKNSEE